MYTLQIPEISMYNYRGPLVCCKNYRRVGNSCRGINNTRLSFFYNLQIILNLNKLCFNFILKKNVFLEHLELIAKRIALKISTADCAKTSVCAKIVIKSMDAQVSISLNKCE